MEVSLGGGCQLNAVVAFLAYIRHLYHLTMMSRSENRRIAKVYFGGHQVAKAIFRWHIHGAHNPGINFNFRPFLYLYK
jgi:hypothetical protein